MGKGTEAQSVLLPEDKEYVRHGIKCQLNFDGFVKSHSVRRGGHFIFSFDFAQDGLNKCHGELVEPRAPCIMSFLLCRLNLDFLRVHQFCSYSIWGKFYI